MVVGCILSFLTSFNNRKFDFPDIRIVITQIFEIGDMVLTLPFISALKNYFPNSRVTVICGKSLIPLVQLFPIIDDFIVYNSPAARSTTLRSFNFFKEVLILIRKMFKLNPDIIIDIRGDICIAFVSLLCLIKNHKMKYLNRCLVYFKKSFLKSKQHEVDKQIFLLHMLVGKNVKFSFSPLLLKSYRKKIPIKFKILKSYLVFHLGAGWEFRILPYETTLETINLILRNTELNIVLTGSKEDLKFFNIAKVIERLPVTDRIVNMVGKTTFYELYCLINNAKLYIGPDTGITHLAALLGKPTIALYGPNIPEKIGPYNVNQNVQVIYHKLKCSPCKQIKCKFPDKYCMSYISPEEIVGRVLEFIDVDKNTRNGKR